MSFLNNRRGRKSTLSAEDRIKQAKQQLAKAEADAALEEAKDNPLLQPLLSLLETVRQRKNTGTAHLSENHSQNYGNRRTKYLLSYLVTLEEERLAQAILESSESDMQSVESALKDALDAIQRGEDPEAISEIVSKGVQSASSESGITSAEHRVHSLKRIQDQYRDLVKLPVKERSAEDIEQKAGIEEFATQRFSEEYGG